MKWKKHSKEGNGRLHFQCYQENCMDVVMKNWNQLKGFFKIYKHLEQQSPNFLAPGTSFVEANFSMDRMEREGACNLDPSHAQFTVGFRLLWESNIWWFDVKLRQWWGTAANTNEALLARSPFSSSWGAQFLIGHKPVHGRGVGDPWSRDLQTKNQ